MHYAQFSDYSGSHNRHECANIHQSFNNIVVYFHK